MRGFVSFILITCAETLKAEGNGALCASDFGRVDHITVAERADLWTKDSFVRVLLDLKERYCLWKLFVVILFSAHNRSF